MTSRNEPAPHVEVGDLVTVDWTDPLYMAAAGQVAHIEPTGFVLLATGNPRHPPGSPIWVAWDHVSGVRCASKGELPAVLLRQYGGDNLGQAQFAWETDVLARCGYRPSTQSADGGHIHVGRLLLTGGLSILAGKAGIRSDGSISVTYQRDHQDKTATLGGQSLQDPAQTDALVGLLQALSELHERGVLTSDEYMAKKAEVLGRF